jgi:hypothetical protein
VRQSATPREDLLAFLQATYEAGANAAKWDRAALERPPLTDAKPTKADKL